MKFPAKKNRLLVSLILVLSVLLLGLGSRVALPPWPRGIAVLSLAGENCTGGATAILEHEPGVVGIAKVRDREELHVGFDPPLTAEGVASRLAAAGMPAKIRANLSPVEYRRLTGHYFARGVAGGCCGGCGR